MKNILTLILFLITPGLVGAQDFPKGFKYLKKGKTEKAMEIFKQNENLCLSKAGILKIAILNDELKSEKQLNNAYIQAKQITECYNYLTQNEKDKYKRTMSNKDIIEIYDFVDRKYYELTLKNGDIQINDQYLKTCKQSKYFPIIYSFSDSCEFSNSILLHTIPAIKNYLLKYPDGKYLDIANAEIEEMDFQSTKKNNTLTFYNLFLEEHPNSRHKQEIMSIIEEPVFTNSKKANTMDAYKDYLVKYPDGKFKKEALSAIEEITFNESIRLFTKESLQFYLSEFPNGKYISEILKNLDNLSKVEDLIIDLKNKNEDLQKVTIQKLGELRCPAAVPALIALLKEDNWSLNKDVIDALGKIKDTRAIDPLIAAFNGSWCEDEAVEALVQIGGFMVFSQLILALKNGNTITRMNSLKALGKLNNYGAIPYLINSLKDEEEDIAMIAATALDNLKYLPEDDDKLYYYLAKGRQNINNNWREIKIMLLDNLRSGNYIDYSVKAFIKIGNKEVIPDLIEIMNNQSGTKIPLSFLNCGQKDLGKAAEKWAKERNYNIIYQPGSRGYDSWGR